MTILVVGAGAVGSLLAWSLASSGRDVTVVRRHASALASAEVALLDQLGKRRTAPVTVVRHPADLGRPPDLIAFGVKMYDLADAVASCDAWPRAPALTVQNGIGAEELVAAARREAGVVAGSLTVSVEPAGDGELRRLTRGGVGLAPFRGAVEPIIAELSSALGAAGLRVRRFDDASTMKWSKLLANLSANATSAIVDLDPVRVYAHPGLFRVERDQSLEALAVMARLGLRPASLPGADVRILARLMRLPAPVGRPVLAVAMARGRGGKDPSLRRHVRSGGGPSEVPWLNGAVVRSGARMGVPTPVNRHLMKLVTEVSSDPARRTWFRRRPDRLLAEIGTDADRA